MLLVWFFVTRAMGRVMDGVADRAAAGGTQRDLERSQRISTLWAVGRVFLLVVLLVALGLLILSVWGLPITPFLALGSVIGVAVGFGAQGVVRDVIAGIFIVAEDQYALGDVVQLGTVSGEVEQIRLRTTVLRDHDGNVHHVPNGSITVASNFTRDYGRVVIDIAVSGDADLEAALALLADEAVRFAADPEWQPVLFDEPEILGVEELGGTSVRLRLAFKVAPTARAVVRREFLGRIKARFDTEGIAVG